MATEVFVGIDVSKDKVDVACRGPARFTPVFERTAPDLAELADELRRANVRRVLLEASGGYERDVLDALHAVQLEIYLVQPLRARSFARSLGKYAKTDAIDAAVLAHMAEVAVDSDLPWQPREDDVERLRALVQRRDHLVTHIDAETKRLRAARLDVVRSSIRRVLDVLNDEKRALEEQMTCLAERSDSIATRLQELMSVDGVGMVTATVLLAEVPELGTLSRNQAASLLGVAPITRESGKWSGHRYTAGGRKRARGALYMAALAATRWNAHLKAFYDRLVARGKPKKLALVAVMRKLIIHLNARMRRVIEPPKTLQSTA